MDRGVADARLVTGSNRTSTSFVGRACFGNTPRSYEELGQRRNCLLLKASTAEPVIGGCFFVTAAGSLVFPVRLSSGHGFRLADVGETDERGSSTERNSARAQAGAGSGPGCGGMRLIRTGPCAPRSGLSARRQASLAWRRSPGVPCSRHLKTRMTRPGAK